MSKPDKPETPEAEKITTRFQTKLGKKGTAIASRVGDKFVSSVNRDHKTRANGVASADVAVAQRRANAKTNGNTTRIIENASTGVTSGSKSMVRAQAGGVSEKAKRQSAGGRSALLASSNVTRAGLHISNIETHRGLDKMQREFRRANEVVNLAGAAAGAAAAGSAGSSGTEVMSNPTGTSEASYNFFDQVDPNNPVNNINGSDPFTLTA